MLIGMLLAAACGDSEPPAAPVGELAPTGAILAALNFANAVLARQDPNGGDPEGVSAELALELGRRLGVPVRVVPYESAARMAEDAPTGAWDIAFLAADPDRARTIAFTAPYLELDASYLVPADSGIQTLDEVDAPGVRIVARPRSAYDLFLRRTLMRAELVYPEGTQTDLDVLVGGRADVLAGLRHVLVDEAAGTPGLRILDGRFAAMGQAIGVPQGRPAAAAYLRDFVEEAKASGLVARGIEASGAPGVSVAPLATR